jgi:hypothetical protein
MTLRKELNDETKMEKIIDKQFYYNYTKGLQELIKAILRSLHLNLGSKIVNKFTDSQVEL